MLIVKWKVCQLKCVDSSEQNINMLRVWYTWEICKFLFTDNFIKTLIKKYVDNMIDFLFFNEYFSKKTPLLTETVFPPICL